MSNENEREARTKGGEKGKERKGKRRREGDATGERRIEYRIVWKIEIGRLRLHKREIA